jgi:hypothetical protein
MVKSRTTTGATIILALAMLAWPVLAQAGNAPAVGGRMAPSPDVSAPSLDFPLSSPARPRRANFLGETSSADAQRVADWVVASADNDGLSFVIVDKIRAEVFVFDSEGQLLGAAPVLLGAARGDDSVPGIGNLKLSSIPPDERTTPAGRFLAEPGRDLVNDVLWIDYGASLALHRVVRGSPGAHRLQRLATGSPSDKRITYGCVEVSLKFYDDVVQKTFTGKAGIVYILPEIKTIQDVFPKA